MTLHISRRQFLEWTGALHLGHLLPDDLMSPLAHEMASTLPTDLQKPVYVGLLCMDVDGLVELGGGVGYKRAPLHLDQPYIQWGPATKQWKDIMAIAVMGQHSCGVLHHWANLDFRRCLLPGETARMQIDWEIDIGGGDVFNVSLAPQGAISLPVQSALGSASGELMDHVFPAAGVAPTDATYICINVNGQDLWIRAHGDASPSEEPEPETPKPEPLAPIDWATVFERLDV